MAHVTSISDLVHIVNSEGSSSFELLQLDLETGVVASSLMPEIASFYASERIIHLLNCIPMEERPFCARAIVSRVVAVSPMDDGPQISLEHVITERSVSVLAVGLNPADNRYLMITLPHSGATGYHSFGAMLEGIVTAEPDTTPSPSMGGNDPRLQREKLVSLDWITPGKLVAVDKETGKLTVADSCNPHKMPAIGIAVLNTNGQVTLQALGFVQGVLSGLSTGKMHFVGMDGEPVCKIEENFCVAQSVGIALSTSILSLSLGLPTSISSVLARSVLSP
jgi:hypothetical protein